MKPMKRRGMHGSVLISDIDTTHTGIFDCLTMIEATSFSILTDSMGTIEGDTGDTIATFTFPAQYEYWGDVSAFRLAAGKVQAYRAQDKS